MKNFYHLNRYMQRVLVSPANQKVSLLLIFLFSLLASFAQTNSLTNNGNWNQASNWSLGIVPTSAHDVEIPNNRTVTVNVNNAVCKSLTLKGGNRATTVSFSSSTSKLSVQGAITIEASTSNNRNKSITVGSATLEAQSVTMNASGSSTRIGQISIGSGTVDIAGNITMGANCRVYFSGNGNLFLGGNLSGGTLTPATGTVTYDGSATQTISGSATTSFYNLVINKSNASNIVNSNNEALSVSNNLTIQSGILNINATNDNYSVSNNLVIAANGTMSHNVNWDTYGKMFSVGGNIQVDGILTHTVRSHIQMSGSGTRYLRSGSNASSTFNILTLVNGNFNANGLVRVADNFWTMFGSTGSFNLSGQTLHASSGVLAAGGSFNLNGGTANISGGLQLGIIGFSGTANISSGTLNVDFINVGDGTNAGTLNHSGGTANISGNLSIQAGCAYVCSNAPVINVSGSWNINNNNGFVAASSTVNFTGGAAHNIAGTATSLSFNQVNINKPSGSLTVGGSIATFNANGNLSIGAGTFNAGSVTNLNLYKDFTNNGTFTAGTSRVHFRGSSAQQMNGSSATTFNALTINNSNGVSLNNYNIYVTGGTNALTFTSGKLNTGSREVILNSATTISGAGDNQYVNGKLRIEFATGNSTKYFRIGDNNTYAPVTLIVSNVTTAGSILATTNGAEHSNILTSNLVENLSVNRSYSLVGTSMAFSNYSAIFYFKSSDVDANADYNQFNTGLYAGGSWSYPVTNNRNPEYIRANNVTALGSFAISESGAAPPTVDKDPTNFSGCSGYASLVDAAFESKLTTSVQWQISTNGGATFSNLTIAPPYSVSTSQTGNEITSGLQIANVTGGMNNYRYRAVASNSRGNVISDAAVLSISSVPVVDAGAALSPICIGQQSAPLGGSVSNVTGGIWTSDAGGTFSPSATDLNAIWIPDANYSGTATLTLTSVGGCIEVDDSKTILVEYIPNPSVLPSTNFNTCSGTIQALSVSNTNQVTETSGTINLSIPDNNATGITNTLNISGIPSNALIKDVRIKFDITHPRVSDLMVNIKAPNGKVLNLFNRVGTTGANFTGTIISSIAENNINTGSAPFTDTYKAMASGSVGPTGYMPDVYFFSGLTSVINGNWILAVRDAAGTNSGSIISWSIEIDWVEPTTWSPVTNLFTDAAATVPYTGQSAYTVYYKNDTPGNDAYTVTMTGPGGCIGTKNISIVNNESPEVVLFKDYCEIPGQIVLTAMPNIPVTSYLWNTGATTAVINADIALPYQVTVTTAFGCTAKDSARLGLELIDNGDFEQGNVGFTSDYTFVSASTSAGLQPEERYTVTDNPTFSHGNFWGRDHTSGAGKMMVVNGSGSNPPIKVWYKTVSVVPNTNYYFSAWAMSMNSVAPFADLQFMVNGVQVGTTTGALPARAANNNPPFDWTRFYGVWNSGSATSAIVSIIDLEQATGGNDFAIDDISFGTLEPFIQLTTEGRDTQTVCLNTPILDIVYHVGGEDSGPDITGLPPGVTSNFDGNNVVISGSPTQAGVYVFTISSTGACIPVSKQGVITVQAQTLTHNSGSTNQTVCVESNIASITYTIGGVATNATVTGLPEGVDYNLTGNTLVISGAPLETGSFSYTVTTSGDCEEATATGTIQVNGQVITHISGSNNQSLCKDVAITPIVYSLEGNITGASVLGLPNGVTGSYSTGAFIISGTPTQGGVFNYTVTTTGLCSSKQATGTINVDQSIGGTVGNVSVCGNGSGTISLSGHSGSIVRWESSFDGVNWMNIASTSTSQTYSFGGITLYYRALIKKGVCNNEYSSIGTVNLRNYWKGTVSSDWNNPDNWADGNVPSLLCPNVTIPVVGGYSPVLSSGVATINNLNVHPGAQLDISNGAVLQIAGTITASGNIQAANGVIELNGTAASQSISGSYFENNTLGGLKISNSEDVEIAGTDTLKIVDEISFGASNAILNVNNNLTLLSTATQTARVDDLTGGGLYSGNNILGNVTVERFIPEHSKAWQLLAVPTKGSTIKSSWMEGNEPMQNNVPGRGTLVTGKSANAVAEGFDLRTASGASIKEYSSTTNQFVDVPSAITTMDNMKGYMLLVRGDRSVTTSNAPATATTLRTTGQLYTQGSEAPPSVNVGAGKWESVGNPYASAINFGLLDKTGGIADLYYVWDPLLTNAGSSYGLGGYQTFTRVGMNYVVTPGGGSYTNGNTNIESGQAFLVTAPSAAGAINFTEAAKVRGGEMVFRESTVPVYFRTQLLATNGGNPILMDGVMNVFDEMYSNNVDFDDARKMINSNENFGIFKGNKLLSVEFRQPVTGADTIQYDMTQMRYLDYQLMFVPVNITFSGMLAYIEDSYLGTSTPVSLTDTTVYHFSVVTAPGSYAPNRFRLVFKPTSTLPVDFTSISANVTPQSDVEVIWTVDNELNMEKYELEKSVDGRNFSLIATYDPTAINGGSATYIHHDIKPGVGNWYYRVKGISNNGNIQYSAVARVQINLTLTGVSVHPIPVQNNTIMVHFMNVEPAKYNATLYNESGQIVYRGVITPASRNEVVSLYVREVPRGVYLLKLKGKGNHSFKLIID